MWESLREYFLGARVEIDIENISDTYNRNVMFKSEQLTTEQKKKLNSILEETKVLQRTRRLLSNWKSQLKPSEIETAELEELLRIAQHPVNELTKLRTSEFLHKEEEQRKLFDKEVTSLENKKSDEIDLNFATMLHSFWNCLQGTTGVSLFDEHGKSLRDPIHILQIFAVILDSSILTNLLKNHFREMEDKYTKSTGFEISSDEIKVDKDNVLGYGSYGMVCGGTWYDVKTKTTIPVAIKMVHPEFGAVYDEKFQKEAKLGTVMRHPNIAITYGYCQEKVGNSVWVCMHKEWSSLKKVLVKMNELKLLFNPSEMFKIALDIAQGMHFLHLAGIIHRDMSTGNFLISMDFTVKVSDFGNARILDEHSAKLTPIPGSIWYLAPEVFTNNYSFPSDVWSYGILLSDICQNDLTNVAQPSIMEVKKLISELTEEDHKYATEFYTYLGATSFGSILIRRKQGLLAVLSTIPSLNKLISDSLSFHANSRPTFNDIIKTLLKETHNLHDHTRPNITKLLLL